MNISNPSLSRGSIQQVYITRIKDNTQVPTVSLSILICKQLNADFDGDALQFTLALDREVENSLDMLAPHMSTFGLDGVRQLASTQSLSKPVVAMIAEWMEDPVIVEPEKLIKMQALQIPPA